MFHMVTIKGIVTGQPRCCGDFTEFSLESGPQRFQVIRLDKQWQIKDLLFLCEGQLLRITGVVEEKTILAKRIEILDCSVRNYHKEREYGNSCVEGTDPGNPQI